MVWFRDVAAIRIRVLLGSVHTLFRSVYPRAHTLQFYKISDQSSVCELWVHILANYSQMLAISKYIIDAERTLSARLTRIDTAQGDLAEYLPIPDMQTAETDTPMYY